MNTRLKTEIEWYDVDDDLPDDNITVLIYTPDEDEDDVWVGYCETAESGDVEWYHSNRHERQNVTHWAHMPEHPEN